ncbi:hypothetical protein ACIRBX_01530 [Kitasatospora sp. NPDC096147]|uniref:hypothetical protein n=1 Tax=Kitasatospora sp. NPDC096147 TaxID=3364093 RepID=UPI00382CB703
MPDLNALTLEFRTTWQTARNGPRHATTAVHPVVDGRDLVTEAFAPGPGNSPEYLLHTGDGLRAATVAREVEPATADCSEECFGALCVTVERVDGQVLWHRRRHPNGVAPTLPVHRFDARRYDAEVARAEQDHGWEWPARTTARLLRELLRERAEQFERWGFPVVSVSSWTADEVTVVFGHPTVRPDGTAPWLPFRSDLAVTDEAPAAQASCLAHESTRRSPRHHAVRCGGSADSARRLGFA